MKYSEDVKKIKALADENRLAIMELLQQGEKCACVLLEELNITQPTLSHHMKLLCDSGMVKGRKEGKWMYYSISKDDVKAFRQMIRSYARCDCELKTSKSRKPEKKPESKTGSKTESTTGSKTESKTEKKIEKKIENKTEKRK